MIINALTSMPYIQKIKPLYSCCNKKHFLDAHIVTARLISEINHIYIFKHIKITNFYYLFSNQ
jgi:hypothetical protein